MGVERHDETPTVDKAFPQTKINRWFAHHPPQEQANALARRRSACRNQITHVRTRECRANGFHRTQARTVSIPSHIFAQRSMFTHDQLIRAQKSVKMGVRHETVEAPTCIRPNLPFERAAPDPVVHAAGILCPFNQLFNLRHELFNRPETQTRRDKRRCFLVVRPFCRLQEFRRIRTRKSPFVLLGILPQQFFRAFCHFFLAIMQCTLDSAKILPHFGDETKHIDITNRRR